MPQTFGELARATLSAKEDKRKIEIEIEKKKALKEANQVMETLADKLHAELTDLLTQGSSHTNKTICEVYPLYPSDISLLSGFKKLKEKARELDIRMVFGDIDEEDIDQQVCIVFILTEAFNEDIPIPEKY
jgi:hypothetical protein